MNVNQASRYAAVVTDHLFTNGSGQRAARLILVSESPAAAAGDGHGRDLGGWCRRAVEDVIRQTLAGKLASSQPPRVEMKPIPLSRDILTCDALRESLRSGTCPACGGGKAEFASLCQACWDRVPEPTQQALMPHVNALYVDALLDAMEFLGTATFHLESTE